MSQRFLRYGAAGWLLIAGVAAEAIAKPKTPVGKESPLHAAPFLKNVETFKREVVFFPKNVSSPYLKVPRPGEHPKDFLSRAGALALGENRLNGSVVMTKDGDLLFSSSNKIFRARNEGAAEKLIGLSDLTPGGYDRSSSPLHIEQLLAASATKGILYLALSTEPEFDPGPYLADKYAHFIGKLDWEARQLLLVKVSDTNAIVIDPKTEMIYEPRKRSVERKDFHGKVEKHWPLSEWVDACWLADDRRSLLLSSSLIQGDFRLLDLQTGRDRSLPISGRAPAWGAGEVLFFMQQIARDDGVIDTSLNRFQIGEKGPTRLFLVSCARKHKDSLPGLPPVVAPNRSWLAWPLPVEYPESGTILLDLKHNEYCILEGLWAGVQIFRP
jgi:hypothetical protein